ncbi:MAG: hypothetical protein J3K34DRAFT_445553 [Monoraphidium minutum]|nr:MAG: hypothetical protein J3K34DRAFT_445553 [Monoraphidium minutum]
MKTAAGAGPGGAEWQPPGLDPASGRTAPLAAQKTPKPRPVPRRTRRRLRRLRAPVAPEAPACREMCVVVMEPPESLASAAGAQRGGSLVASPHHSGRRQDYSSGGGMAVAACLVIDRCWRITGGWGLPSRRARGQGGATNVSGPLARGAAQARAARAAAARAAEASSGRVCGGVGARQRRTHVRELGPSWVGRGAPGAPW